VAVVLAEDAAHAADRFDAGSGEVALADRLVPVVVGRIDRTRVDGAVRDRERAALVWIVDPDVPVDQAVPDHDAGSVDLEVAVDRLGIDDGVRCGDGARPRVIR
jgi:hypothetical protein